MPAQRTNRPRVSVSPGALERLQVLWVVSSLLLLVLIVLVALFGAGALHRLATPVDRQSQAIDELSARLAELENAIAELSRELDRPRAAEQDPDGAGPFDQTRLDESEAPGPGAQATSDRLRDIDVGARLAKVLALNAGGELPQLSDAQGGLELLDEVTPVADRLDFSGSTWADLAVLALLLGEQEQAERFAFRAASAGVVPRRFYEVLVRQLLAAGSSAEALVLARRLADGPEPGPVARVLLASTQFALGRLADADAVLAPLPDVRVLSTADRLRLAQVLVALERWDDLDAAISDLADLTAAEQLAVNQHRALLAIQNGRFVVALGILDHLLESRPEDYDLRTWRGVALLRAGQFDAARAALAHAERNAGRPEAWYWRGILEMESGNLAAAVQPLETALAADTRFVAAREALATLALNGGDIAGAIQHLHEAVKANPRRAMSHFLLAVAYAKTARRAETEEALRRALVLDPDLLATARQTEVIGALFAMGELERLAEPEPTEARERHD